jgi:dynein heavy chain
MPIYNSAKKALNTLNKDNIDEIKKYTTVGEEIEKVFCAVCLLFKRPENFEQARKLMADPKKFIADLQGYNAEAMPESVHKKLKKYTTDPKLTPEILEKKSAACKSICLFIRALDSFAEVMKIIKPKQKALAEAEAELKVAQEALGVKQAAL